eukprot:COSAG01_NODE_1456_length_10254_cov_12.591630_8_plen_72_part_00
MVAASDISMWDVSSATTMVQMFNHAGHFDGDLSLWDVARVVDMRQMFNQATQFGDRASSFANPSGMVVFPS